MLRTLVAVAMIIANPGNAQEAERRQEGSVFYDLGKQLGSKMIGTLIGGIAYQLERCGVADFEARARTDLGMESWSEDEIRAFEAGFAEGEALVVENDAETGEGYDEEACRSRAERIVKRLEAM